MIYTKKPPGGVFRSLDEMEAYEREVDQLKIKFYEEYLEKGHEWCWSLVGNIVNEHRFGEEKDIKSGTKHFSAGTKVYLAPSSWGDGYERIHVIGLGRGKRRFIEIVMQRKYIENFRIQKVYKPAIVRRMLDSENIWWGDSDDDRETILEYLKFLCPEEAEVPIDLLEKERGETDV